MKKEILVVEDEITIAKGIIFNLEANDYHVRHASDSPEALRLIQSKIFDLIILDVMLPSENGFHLLERLRKKNIFTPVLMLTALSDTPSRIQGIRIGADDYLGKPFALDELLARVEALIRRDQWNKIAPPQKKSFFRLGSLEFDTQSLVVRRRTDPSKAVSLTPLESRLLELLCENTATNPSPPALSRSQILTRVWGVHASTQTRTLDMFIARLRHIFQELGHEQGEQPLQIESVRGVGYRLVDQKTQNSKNCATNETS